MKIARLAVCTAAMALSFVACSDDDDQPNRAPTNNTVLPDRDSDPGAQPGGSDSGDTGADTGPARGDY